MISFLLLGLDSTAERPPPQFFLSQKKTFFLSYLFPPPLSLSLSLSPFFGGVPRVWGKGVRTKKVVICSPPLSPRSKLFSISRILIIFCPFYFGEIERCAIGEKEGKEDDERTFSEWIAIEDRSKYMENKK